MTAPASQFLVEIEGLMHRIGDRCVLDLESLRLTGGTVYALIGHNGAGKTTLLRILAGLDKPTEGALRLHIDNRDVILCFQQPHLFYGSVARNIEYGLRLRGRRMDAAAQEVIGQLGLRPFLDRNARGLSSGETQRVALARALVCRPKLLLLDEPLANLDAVSAEAIERQIRAFRSNGGSVVCATHIAESVYRLAAEVLAIDHGRLVEAQINNVLSATIVRHEDEACADLGSGVRIHCVTHVTGACRIAIPASDIVLSRTELESSMRNRFRGVVRGMRERDGSVEATVDIGTPLSVQLTHASVRSMNITPGDRVFVSFKATSVKVYQ